MSEQSTELVVREAAAVSPLDLPAEIFRAGLDRRGQNRAALMEWIRAALVEKIDFGRIHFVSKEKCGRGSDCDNPKHWSKPCLFKPGAEKICGMLGVTVAYPTLSDYEQAALHGIELQNIILRCEIRDNSGRVVADGVGARSVKQDYGDINKALKMAEKSAHIDATLRMAGLSEVFTQDLEDMSPEKTGNGATGNAPADRPAQDALPNCPRCGQPLRLSKFGDSYLYCWNKKNLKPGEPNGCGAQWTREEWEVGRATKELLPDTVEAQTELLDAQSEPLESQAHERIPSETIRTIREVFEPPAGPKSRKAQEKAARAFVKGTGPSKDDEREARELF